MWERREELINTVFTTPAVTPAGMNAKAVIAMRVSPLEIPGGYEPERDRKAMHSLAADILARIAA
jgi:hypothetical protein